MRIQHNIMAMNAYRNYNNNNKALSGNLEKLSSGYKINRAGDDAAGLAISEKMRAQITGLNAAQKNVKDGISLVKTAEGAMQEIQDMLNRMDYLATQSANGTYDNEVDRANLQKEVDNLKTEINRIADSANFNGIKLLNGDLDANQKAVTETVTTTTGGQSDVPILQDVATDPTAEVGTKTVLRGNVAEKGKAEINIALHDLSLKGQDGDTFTVTVGDAEIKLNVKAAGTANAANGELEADKSYSGKELATAIVNAFKQGDKKIGGQEFTASVATTNDGVKFVQTNMPTSASDVVDTANVKVDVDFTQSTTNAATEYTIDISSTAIANGDTIKIGDFEKTINTNLATTFGTGATGADANGYVTVGDYKVKYDNGKLLVKDPDGTNGKPEVSYTSYGDAVKLDPKKTAGTDAVKAKYTVDVTSTGTFSAAVKAQYSFQVDPSAFVAGNTIGDGTATYTVGTDISVADANNANKLAAFLAANTTDTNYDVRADGDKIIFTAKTAGTVKTGNAGGTTAAPAAAPSLTLTVAQGTGASTGAIGGDVTSGTAITCSEDVAGTDADTIKFKDQTGAVVTLTVSDKTDVAGGKISAADAADAEKLASVIAQKLTSATNSAYTVTAEGGKLVFTANTAGEVKAGNTVTAAPTNLFNTGSIAGGSVSFGTVTEDVEGADATKAYSEYDLSSLKEGDIITVGGKDFKVPAGGFNATNIATVKDTTSAVDFDDTVIAAAKAAAGVANNPTVTVVDGKLKIELATADAGAKAGPSVTIKVKPKESTVADVKDPVAGASGMTGTWNVQSTNHKDGGYGAPSPLASTAFDLTADMVKDGNSLTIGESTYVFKVGKDSTVTATGKQTLIDLSKYEADSADLINAAGKTLADQSPNNSAFTIGYAKDSGKITIHEKKDQKVYDDELKSVEEFDKLVYMTAPEVTTSEEVTTGKDGKPLTLQIGDTSDSFNQMKVSIGDMHTKAMGTGEYVDENGDTVKVEKTIADIDIGNQEGAAEAVQVIKNAINYVSSVRGDLGAIQNRLDHTANNLSVMAENIQDAESTIRDTDVAEEMMSYVKNNILVQSAQAMLAQANQVPQGVLQLLG